MSEQQHEVSFGDLSDRRDACEQHDDRCQVKSKFSNARRPAQHTADIVDALIQCQTRHGQWVVVPDDGEISFTPSQTL